MGFLDELKKLTQPYDEDDDFFEESEKPARSVTVKPRPSSAAAASAGMEFENAFGSQATGAAAPEPVESDDDDEEMSGGLFGNLGKRIKKENRSLVMTLEGLPTETARRLLDFMSGIVFALHGKITPVSAKTYFISPENVDLLGADAAAGTQTGSAFD